MLTATMAAPLFPSAADSPGCSQANTRHELDPARVAQQVAARILGFEADRARLKAQAQTSLESYDKALQAGTAHLWSRPPEGPGYVDSYIDGRIAQEQKHYASVRVIELPQEGKRFILVYGDVDDALVRQGTGPFESLEAAADWFYRSGR